MVLFFLFVVGIDFFNVCLFAIAMDIMDAVEALLLVVGVARRLLIVVIVVVVIQVDGHVSTAFVADFVAGEGPRCNLAVVICR